ncbi:MAG: hypothetical protein GY847_24005 [Proteobacteria bacterium]|nr:hypothetical protein [Pseudomonadota bacterium]
MKNLLGVMTFVALSVGCSTTQPKFDSDTDGSDGGVDITVGCNDDDYRCDGDMVQKCVSNLWEDWNDCPIRRIPGKFNNHCKQRNSNTGSSRAPTCRHRG